MRSDKKVMEDLSDSEKLSADDIIVTVTPSHSLLSISMETGSETSLDLLNFIAELN